MSVNGGLWRFQKVKKLRAPAHSDGKWNGEQPSYYRLGDYLWPDYAEHWDGSAPLDFGPSLDERWANREYRKAISIRGATLHHPNPRRFRYNHQGKRLAFSAVLVQNLKDGLEDLWCNDPHFNPEQSDPVMEWDLCKAMHVYPSVAHWEKDSLPADYEGIPCYWCDSFWCFDASCRNEDEMEAQADRDDAVWEGISEDFYSMREEDEFRQWMDEMEDYDPPCPGCHRFACICWMDTEASLQKEREMNAMWEEHELREENPLVFSHIDRLTGDKLYLYFDEDPYDDDCIEPDEWLALMLEWMGIEVRMASGKRGSGGRKRYCDAL